MKYIAFLVAALISTSAFADSIETGVDYKDKVNSDYNHTVYFLSYNKNVSKDLTVGIRTENEVVSLSQALEGLVQAQTKYSLSNSTPFTPFVNGAIGQKFKDGTNFTFWVVGAGVNTRLTDDISFDTAVRRREAFSSDNNYATTETSVKLNYALAKNHIVSVKYAVERGTSDYNTTGVSYQYKF